MSTSYAISVKNGSKTGKIVIPHQGIVGLQSNLVEWILIDNCFLANEKKFGT